MATKIKITSEIVDTVLAGLTVEQLQKIAGQKRLESVGPLIDAYNTTADKLAEIKGKIQEVNPEWRPPTLGDKIVSWVSEQPKAVTAKQIREQFKNEWAGMFKVQLNKAIASKRLTVDAGGNHSVPKE